jgi:hypothetical protein
MHGIFMTVLVLPFSGAGVRQNLISSTPGVELRNVFVQHFDRGVDLPVEGGLVAQGFVQAIESFAFGQAVIFEELCFPAVEASQSPAGGGDLFDIVSFEEVSGRELCEPFGFELSISFGVFAEGREDDVTGEEPVCGGIAAGDGFAGIGGRHSENLSLFL